MATEPFTGSGFRSVLLISGTIEFRHPGQHQDVNTFLDLPCVDAVPGHTTRGLHYRTAITACEIVAHNAFGQGRLTLDPEGLQPVEASDDTILQDYWPKVYKSNPKLGCALSKTSSGVEKAYLVPPVENCWYSTNGMQIYETPDLRDSKVGRSFPTGIENLRNWLYLRMDLCSVFQQAWFAIVPKRIDPTSTDDPKWVVHTLSPAAGEFWSQYHNRIVDELEGGSQPYLFCRFAWAIFQRVELLRERMARRQEPPADELNPILNDVQKSSVNEV